MMGSGTGEAALHKEMLCDLLGRLVSSTQGSGFQKDVVDGAPEQLSLPFIHSRNQKVIQVFLFFYLSLALFI